MIRDKIIIVEDDPGISKYLQAALRSHEYDTLLAPDGKTALEMIASHCPDLLLLDLGLPDMDGSEIIRSVRAWSRMPIIIISARSAEIDKASALDMGADDYLTKPFNILELKARIRALLRRAGAAKKQEPEQKLVCGHITLDRSSRSASREDVPVDLTAKEFDLMELLMRNPNRVYSRETLLDAIWGYDVSSEIRTVDVHIRRLREKLELNPAQPEHILTKWGVGYYFKY